MYTFQGIFILVGTWHTVTIFHARSFMEWHLRISSFIYSFSQVSWCPSRNRWRQSSNCRMSGEDHFVTFPSATSICGGIFPHTNLNVHDFRNKVDQLTTCLSVFLVPGLQSNHDIFGIKRSTISLQSSRLRQVAPWAIRLQLVLR
jgi:hypothetical protein